MRRRPRLQGLIDRLTALLARLDLWRRVLAGTRRKWTLRIHLGLLVCY
jgi:hypothetical protein